MHEIGLGCRSFTRLNFLFFFVCFFFLANAAFCRVANNNKPHSSSTPITGRPDQEATEVRVGGERGHSAPAPVANGVHQGRGLKAKGCCP